MREVEPPAEALAIDPSAYTAARGLARVAAPVTVIVSVPAREGVVGTRLRRIKTTR